VNFIVEFPGTTTKDVTQALYVDGSSNKKGSGAGIVLEGQ